MSAKMQDQGDPKKINLVAERALREVVNKTVEPVAVMTHAIGCFDEVSDDFEVRGWAWNESTPTAPTSIKIMIDQQIAAIIQPQDFRAGLMGAGIGHGCFAFNWPIPARYFDGTPHEISIDHVIHEAALPGSPKTKTLPVLEQVSHVPLTAPFVNPDFAQWPDGLQGLCVARLQEITPGLIVVADESAGVCSYMVAEPRQTTGRNTSYYGIRIETEQPAALWVHHRISPVQHQTVESNAVFSIELALGEADEALTQRPTELWLTRQSKDGFEKVRRLARGRVFRKATLITFGLHLSAEERNLAAKRVLHLGVMVDRCRSLRLHPCRVISTADPPSLGFIAFEDSRLTHSFEKCRELANANGNAAVFRSLMGEPPAVSTRLLRRASNDSTSKDFLAIQYPFTQIVLPVYNGDKYVADCVKSVLCETNTPFQLVLVNDGSRKLTTSMLRDLAASDQRIVLIDRSQNRGYTQSVNEAVKFASAEWIVILNSDTIVSHEWLAKLHDAAMSAANVGMVGPLSNAASWQSIPHLKEADGTWSKNDFITAADVASIQARLDEIAQRSYPSLPLLNGFCTLIRRQVFEQCGLYDEDAFPIGYGEENDLCLRATKAGFLLILADDCFVFHHKSITFGTEGRKPLSRAGTHELLNKHPGIMLHALEMRLQADPTLARLRNAMSDLPRRLR